MSELSVHDNTIVAYKVDHDRRRIVINTVFKHSDSHEHTNVVFEGVLAYRFECDNFDNCIFGIEEESIEQLVKREAPSFEYGVQYDWPGSWNTSPEASIEYLKAHNGKAFSVAASTGMWGWVVAESFELQATTAF